jgi:hypothetical protein
MSYQEYESMFKEAQGRGKYHMFLFDIEDSRNLDPIVHFQAKKLLLDVYERLEYWERASGKKILHHPKKVTWRADSREPFYGFMGDEFGFTIVRGSMRTEDILWLWQEEKGRLGIKFKFHFVEGDYETDDWAKGQKLYFRGYCMQQLNYIDKKNTKLV